MFNLIHHCPDASPETKALSAAEELVRQAYLRIYTGQLYVLQLNYVQQDPSKQQMEVLGLIKARGEHVSVA